MSLQSKLSSDASAAEGAIRRKKAELQRKARQGMKAARRRARRVDRDDVKAAASRVAASAGDPRAIESDADGIGDRAYRAGQAPAVVDASLDPAPSGEGMQLFASGSGMVDESFIDGRRGGPRQPEEEPQPMGLSFDEGDGGFFASDDEDEGDLLSFDDPMGAGGGWF